MRKLLKAAGFHLPRKRQGLLHLPGVGGMKVFRDEIWGHLRVVFQADHRAYRRVGIYDFPQREWGVRALNPVTGLLFKIPQVQEGFAQQVKEQMVRPYRKIVQP